MNKMKSESNKKFSRLAIFFMAVFFLFSIGDTQVQAQDLDKIENYTIEVDNYNDGSLKIQYHIEWRVLDSTSEGPLTWIRVGIPNEYVEEITALSSNIDKIRYSSDGGDYVRIDLDREYEAGEVVDIDFSIHQHRMYENRDGNYIYSFTPGWFDEMVIDEMEIRWSAYEGMDSQMALENGCFVAREENLAHSQKMQVVVFYEMDTYDFGDDYDSAAVSASSWGGNIIVLLVIFVGGPILWVIYLLKVRPKHKDTDYYDAHSGMGHAYHSNHHRSARGYRSGGCACACACACAGGGRAGCSVKEFYSAKKWSLRKGEIIEPVTQER